MLAAWTAWPAPPLTRLSSATVTTATPSWSVTLTAAVLLPVTDLVAGDTSS